MHFRYALREVLYGNHPSSSSWVVNMNHPVLYRGGEPRELGPLPPRWKSWPIDEQHRLSQILVGANIRNIVNTCTYPDWLGYLGLGLKYSEEAEQETRAVTKSWIPQLQEVRAHIAQGCTMLQSILESSDQVLTWRTLEALE